MTAEEAETWLAPGERVLVEAKQHWKSFAGVLLLGLIAGLALAGVGFDHAAHAKWIARGEHVRPNQLADRIAEHQLHGLELEILGGVVFLVFLVVGFVRWRTTRYFVTDQRVVARRGLVVRTGSDAPLGKVQAIRFRQGVTDRLFGTGTVVVASGAFRAVKLWSIRNWQEAHAKVHEGQRAAAQPIGPRFGPPPPSMPNPNFGSAAPFAAPQPAPSPVPSAPPAFTAPPPAPEVRQANDGPPVPPWLRDDLDAPTLNL